MKAVLTLLFLAPLCTSCDFRGLDLSTPNDARKYVQACGRGIDAIHCRAMQRVLATVPGEVTVLLPNYEDREIRASLEAYVRSTGRSPNLFEQSAVGEEYARANIFLAPTLKTGTMTTLDEKTHTVLCEKNANGVENCTIDGFLSSSNQLQFRKDTVGSVFKTYNLKDQMAASAYLPF